MAHTMDTRSKTPRYPPTLQTTGRAQFGRSSYARRVRTVASTRYETATFQGSRRPLTAAIASSLEKYLATSVASSTRLSPRNTSTPPSIAPWPKYFPPDVTTSEPVDASVIRAVQWSGNLTLPNHIWPSSVSAQMEFAKNPIRQIG